MAYEITNKLRGPSILRVDGAATTNLTYSAFSTNTSIESVTTLAIKKIAWSTTGTITVGQGGTNVLTLSGSGQMDFDHMNYSVANNSTNYITVTVNTGGCAVLELAKTATYSPALTGI
jgi:hypothetical protein